MDPSRGMHLVLVLMTTGGMGWLPGQEWWVDAHADARRSTGSSNAPWTDLRTALGNPDLQPGDSITIRPGLYRGGDMWVTTSRIRIARDRSLPGRVILDGGVSANDLRNRAADGTLKAINNGPITTKVLGVRIGADDVTIDGLEVRNGHVGLFTEARRTRILDCHVHHTSNCGISCTGPNVEIAYNVVHDVVLYNIDGQCLVKSLSADGSPNQNDWRKVVNASGIVTDQNMDWAQGITCKGDYPRKLTANYTKITVDGLVHDNLLWNAWSEGFGTFCAKGTVVADNTAFNNWRVGYYVQNADQVQLAGNLNFLCHDTFDAWALRGGIVFANELDRFYFAAANPIGTFLLPDTSGLTLRCNVAVGGSSCLSSTFGSPLNTQPNQVVSITGNLLMAPPAGKLCLEIGDKVKGDIRVAGNILLKDGADPMQERQFLTYPTMSGTRSAIATNRLANLPGTMPRIDAGMAAVVDQARLLEAATDGQDTAPLITLLRARVASLRQDLDRIRGEQAIGPNTAPTIIHTAVRQSELPLSP